MNEDFAKMFRTMMEQGQEMAKAFAPALEGVDVKGFEKLFPSMPPDMLEMWFGKTFNPEGLDARTRLLVTIAALTIWQMSMFGGLPAMQKALEIAQSVFAEVEEKKE